MTDVTNLHPILAEELLTHKNMNHQCRHREAEREGKMEKGHRDQSKDVKKGRQLKDKSKTVQMQRKKGWKKDGGFLPICSLLFRMI